MESRRYDESRITLLDPYLDVGDDDVDGNGGVQGQNPHAASIDSSRIVRADYASLAYARLAAAAQERWRGGFGRVGDGGGDVDVNGEVYKESGVILTMGKMGSGYVEGALRNARELGMGSKVRVLEGKKEVVKVLGTGGRGRELGRGDMLIGEVGGPMRGWG